MDIRRVWGLFGGNHGLDKHKGYEIICKLHALGKRFHGFHQFISRPGVAYDEGINKVQVSLDPITTDARVTYYILVRFFIIYLIRLLINNFILYPFSQENPEAVDFVLRGQPEYTKLREIFIDEGVSGVDWRSCFDFLHGRGL